MPIQAFLIPNYVIMVKLRLYDTLHGLVLVTAASLIAISVLLTVNCVRLIPKTSMTPCFPSYQCSSCSSPWGGNS